MSGDTENFFSIFVFISFLIDIHFNLLNFVLEPGAQRTDDVVAYDGTLAASQKDYNFC